MGAALPGVAAAAPRPAILYIPRDVEVTLHPTGLPPCTTDVNSALGCANVPAQVQQPPYQAADALAAAMLAVLDPYDVLVTHQRPPEYVSYTMLLPSDDPDPRSSSLTCTAAAINCAARRRADVIFTSGTTTQCMDPQIVHASLYAFGRSSGLEGVVDPGDYMSYVPDYAVNPMGFLDVCSDRTPQQGLDDRGMQVPLPLECPDRDHPSCPLGGNGLGQQNSHQELLAAYGPRTEDTAPPVLDELVPPDGAVLMPGEDLVLDVEIADADPVVAVRWTLTSAALEEVLGRSSYTKCTNDVCDSNWPDANPLKATDSSWQVIFAGLPEGEYEITLEVVDYHGNGVVEGRTVTIGEPPSETGTGSSGDPGMATFFPVDFTDSGDGLTTTPGLEPAASGCACTAGWRSGPHGWPWWLALLRLVRRRAR